MKPPACTVQALAMCARVSSEQSTMSDAESQLPKVVVVLWCNTASLGGSWQPSVYLTATSSGS
eukprot:5707101-Amphidinium_carterae.1